MFFERHQITERLKRAAAEQTTSDKQRRLAAYIVERRREETVKAKARQAAIEKLQRESWDRVEARLMRRIG